MSAAPDPASRNWLVTPRPRPEARLRLLCFAYAGGGSAAFTGWADALPPDAELSAVRLPGRESRILQRPYTRLDDLLPDLVRAVSDYCREPYVLFGHSMGALIAYAYARRLCDAGPRGPEHLIVSGRRAPQLPHNRPLLHDLADGELLRRLREFGGTTDELLSDPRTMRLVLPGLRADFQLNDTYRYTPEPRLDCPVTAFGGRQDSHVDGAGIAAWADRTTGPFAVRMLDGGHFFLHSSQAELLRAIGVVLHRTTGSTVA
ncbi:alpha/beta fold hydrolase [Streptomyces sp. NBC_01754]|uniref:thioesterase II family protein n=1 Tax=Streptomyces sp. NBC_01754 TaxID=2975930 RepID=UPI002DD98426|nr:alpha/beta fold hydrolase [Streptomyces sp. NBC_01754]WSC93385.1 alpha/beta fold hydrolase [Streptomyces sp. NBC_01754]